MRIIAGQYGSRIIKTPTKSSIHPMGEKIRGAIFNRLATELPGALVLDAFAGSGAVGLEALSRGAAHVTFVESDRQAIRVINNNLADLNISTDKFSLIPTTVMNWLGQNQVSAFDIILADPPYFDVQDQTIIRLASFLKPNGQLILSNPKRANTLELPGLILVEQRVYSEARISIYHVGPELDSAI